MSGIPTVVGGGLLAAGRATVKPVGRFALVLAVCGAGLAASRAGWDGSGAATVHPSQRTVEVAVLARSWSAEWTVTGTKTEPTYVETVRIERRGDWFAVEAAAYGQRLGRVEMSVDGHGQVAVLACSPGLACDTRPTGFLATVPLLAAARRGQDLGRAPVLAYAGREVACVPVDLLRGVEAGVAEAEAGVGGDPSVRPHAVLDPCFDILTGAVLAQRTRDGGGLSGPTLDEGTLIVLDRTTGTGPRTSGWRLGAVQQVR
ncbi:MAG TPA: hypothetical protein VFB84_10100 [Micromonosporaceae bacterium]|nr:hypothetical protein [Micromonosporaceae bacterium]